MTNEKQIAELDRKLKAAKELGDDDLIRKYQTEINRLTGKPAKSTGSGYMVIPGVSEEDYESAGSKFAAAGAHLSEFGMPEWKSPGVSMVFPFTITSGPDIGKIGEIFVGVKKDAVWKLKEILRALGVPTSADKSGNVQFDPNEVAGKTAQTIWQTFKDTRSPEEGGKGTTYTKPVGVIPEGAEPPADII